MEPVEQGMSFKLANTENKDWGLNHVNAERKDDLFLGINAKKGAKGFLVSPRQAASGDTRARC